MYLEAALMPRQPFPSAVKFLMSRAVDYSRMLPLWRYMSWEGDRMMSEGSACLALLPCERLDDDGPIGGGEATEVVGIRGLDLAASCFHRDRNRVGVRKQRRARACL